MTELIETYTAQESSDMCAWGVCKYWAYDMDGCFCTHPKSMEIGHPYGASTNRMSLEGYCTGCYDDKSKNQRQLFERVE